MIVMVVRQQYRVERRQLFQCQCGRIEALRPEQRGQRRPLTPNRIGQDCHSIDFNQDGGMTHPRDTESLQWRRSVRRDIRAKRSDRLLRISAPPLEQQAANHARRVAAPIMLVGTGLRNLFPSICAGVKAWAAGSSGAISFDIVRSRVCDQMQLSVRCGNFRHDATQCAAIKILRPRP